MGYLEFVAIILCFTALLLIRQIVLASRRNSEDSVEDDHTGRALNPEALAKVDGESMREFDRLLVNVFSEEE